MRHGKEIAKLDNEKLYVSGCALGEESVIGTLRDFGMLFAKIGWYEQEGGEMTYSEYIESWTTDPDCLQVADDDDLEQYPRI